MKNPPGLTGADSATSYGVFSTVDERARDHDSCQGCIVATAEDLMEAKRFDLLPGPTRDTLLALARLLARRAAKRYRQNAGDSRSDTRQADLESGPKSASAVVVSPPMRHKP